LNKIRNTLRHKFYTTKFHLLKTSAYTNKYILLSKLWKKQELTYIDCCWIKHDKHI